MLGGRLGIRTPDSFHYASFQDWCFRPLSQPSTYSNLLQQKIFMQQDYVSIFLFAMQAFSKKMWLAMQNLIFCTKNDIVSNVTNATAFTLRSNLFELVMSFKTFLFYQI